MIRLKSLLFEQQSTYKLYVDMGGVLFKKMSADVGGSGDNTEFIGDELWNVIKKYNPIVLSAIGSKNIEDKKRIKTDQVKKYLHPTPPIEFVTLGTDKKKFANDHAILIDDSKENIDAWELKNGIGILYDNIQPITNTLKKYFDLEN